MRVKLFALLMLFISPAALAQGFAGLGTNAEGFALPDRATRLSFPKDHGAHPDFRIEWWYLTATLHGADGKDYGIQWTLFRSALRPDAGDSGWSSPQLWMGHAGLTTPTRHFSAERFARGGIAQAGVTASPFHAWIDNWRMQGPDLDHLALTAQSPEFRYDLTLTADGPLVLHGEQGYSVKSASGQASYYYSQPHYTVTGTLHLPDGPVAVTGKGWLDREWSSQPLADDQSGWDWFSLRFATGEKLMGFALRGGGETFTSGTWIAVDGTASPLQPGALRAVARKTTHVAGRDIPTQWDLILPERDLEIRVEALSPNSWMETSVPYWEGPVSVSGTHNGKGYLEMTGY
jgi:predicted secreted hydrolase